jgi:hypothetical protein
MSDGMIGQSHITIPDLTEPVVGFRAFRVIAKQEAVEDKFVEVWERDPHANPFVPPNEYITDPFTGKAIPNYDAIAEAQKKWQASLGKKTRKFVPGHLEIPAMLVSPTQQYQWKPGRNEATCNRRIMEHRTYGTQSHGAHAAPHSQCQCGLYSYYDCSKLSTTGNTVVGIVTQWGQIEAHSEGMRSEFMKIEALCGVRDMGRDIAEEWGIPFISYTPGGSRPDQLLETIVTEFGSPLPVSMRPKSLTPELDPLAQQMWNQIYPSYPPSSGPWAVLGYLSVAFAIVVYIALIVMGLS